MDATPTETGPAPGLPERLAALAERQRAAEGRLVMLLGPGACPPAARAGDGEWWDADLGSLFGLALALRRDLAVLRDVRVASLVGGGATALGGV